MQINSTKMTLFQSKIQGLFYQVCIYEKQYDPSYRLNLNSVIILDENIINQDPANAEMSQFDIYSGNILVGSDLFDKTDLLDFTLTVQLVEAFQYGGKQSNRPSYPIYGVMMDAKVYYMKDSVNRYTSAKILPNNSVATSKVGKEERDIISAMIEAMKRIQPEKRDTAEKLAISTINKEFDGGELGKKVFDPIFKPYMDSLGPYTGKKPGAGEPEDFKKNMNSPYYRISESVKAAGQIESGWKGWRQEDTVDWLNSIENPDYIRHPRIITSAGTTANTSVALPKSFNLTDGHSATVEPGTYSLTATLTTGGTKDCGKVNVDASGNVNISYTGGQCSAQPSTVSNGKLTEANNTRANSLP